MSETDYSRSNVIPFPGKAVPKFGFKRVKRRGPAQMEAEGQLNLFAPPPQRVNAGFGRGRRGQVFHLPTVIGPFERAVMLHERGDDGAARMYWKAITLGDSVADAYCNLGIIESERGETSKAFNCFTNALENNPRHFESHYNVANLYLESGDLRLARLHYEIAAEIEPSFPQLYFNLGLVHAMDENFKAAVAALSNYKELAPDFEDNPADELLVRFKRSLSTRR